MVIPARLVRRFWCDPCLLRRLSTVAASSSLASNIAESTTPIGVAAGGVVVESAPLACSFSGGGRKIDGGGDDGDGRHDLQLVATAKGVCEAVLRRPRWESFLLSEFPPTELFHPICIRLVLRTLSIKPLHSLRYLFWLSSQPEAPAVDAATSGALLEALASAGAWKAALLAIRSMKCQSDPPGLESFFLRLIVNEEGAIGEAVEAMSHAKTHLSYSPPLPIWNSALSSSLRGKRTDLVWRLYEMMMQARIAGDASTAGYLIQAFCLDNKLEDAYRLLRQVSKDGLVPDVISITKLVIGFCKGGNFSMVSELLHLMIAGGCMPDIFTYQSIIHGLCENGKGDDGFQIFNDLKMRGYAPDLVTYTTMIDGLCKMGKMVAAWNLWMEMMAIGIHPNEYAYNTIIDGYCKAGDLGKAQKLYQEMCRTGFKESTVSCNTMIAGLCLQGRMEESVNMFKEMPRQGIEPDVITYNTLIQGFCKEGMIGKATKLYENLLVVGLEPSVSTYTPLIQALCGEGNVLGAVELLRCMKAKNLEPLVCTNDIIINGFCKTGKGEEGMAWLLNMLVNNLKPQRDTVNRLLECLGNKLLLDDALLVLNAMLKIGYVPATSVCYSLVNQLCQGRQGQVALQVDEVILCK